jgi:hypothetical protein
MKPEIVHRCLVAATLAIFPVEYNSPRARAMLLSIGLQETEFKARRQLVAGEKRWWKSQGPAVGYWQNERIGIQGIMQHHRAGPMLRNICDTLGYPFDLDVLYDAVKYDNILAVVIARLMLWVHPDPLPGPNDVSTSWQYYLRTWRPGKPHPERWEDNYRRAWEIVGAGADA